MPKEYINCRDFDRRFPFTNPDGTHTGELSKPDHSAVKVSWERDHEWVALVVVDRVEDPDAMSDGLKFMNFDRSGINRLIQTLRRARDAAFGADA